MNGNSCTVAVPVRGQEKYSRLAELKRRWDPDNLFRLNQNISAQA